jgi:D-alanyl-D-alanine carboxypeptidase
VTADAPAGDDAPFTPFDADVDHVIGAELPASASGPLGPAVVDVIDAAARGAFEACAGTPGAVVGVRSPEGTWTTAYGLADPDAGVPMSTDVHLRIGSVTKTFVATVLLQLVTEGRLALDAPIADFVDDVPGGQQITLGLLASMRSGLANYTDNPLFTGRIVADPTSTFAATDMVEAGLAVPVSFEPDARFEYSNTNYILLGLVLEQVTGQDLGELLRTRILEPLALSATSWPGTSCEIPAPWARGFTISVPSASPVHPVDTTGWNPSWAGAAGAVISTLDDLLVYARAIVTGQGLLGGPAQEQRLRSFRPAPAFGEGIAYGLGLMSVDRWIGHSGDIPGYRAAVYHEPVSDTTLVVLTSSDIMAGRCSEPVAAMAIASDAACKAPTARIFDDVATALGIPTETPHPS